MSLIAVEGPDLAGKTTLVSNLRSRFQKEEPRRAAVYGPHVCFTNSIALAEQMSRPDFTGSLVLDRCWVSEYVYSRVYGRVDVMSDAEAWLLGLLYSHIGALLIVLDVTDDILRQRYGKFGDDSHDLDVVLDTASVYRRHVHRALWLPRDTLVARTVAPRDVHVGRMFTLDSNSIGAADPDYLFIRSDARKFHLRDMFSTEMRVLASACVRASVPAARVKVVASNYDLRRFGRPGVKTIRLGKNNYTGTPDLCLGPLTGADAVPSYEDLLVKGLNTLRERDA